MRHLPAFVAIALGLSPVLPAATAPVEIIVNQTGTVPLAGVQVVDFKFAIVSYDLPDPAVGTATVSGGAITAITLQSGGNGYLKAPAITITGGGGRGAKATATLTGGVVTAVTVTAAGTGYTSAPTISFAAPTSKPVIASLWSNDNTSVAGSEPTSAVSLQVVNGGYSALLGYTGLPNMAALPRQVLANLDARVRVWVKGKTKFKQLLPDQPLKTVPYAEEASYAETAGGTVAGGISTSMLADGAVTLAKIAPGVIPGSGGSAALSGSLLANDTALTSQGYTRVQTISGGQWINSAADGSPSGRSRHTALWTGSKLIVFGGSVTGLLSAQGGLYSDAPGTWALLPTPNAPAARADHTAVWTGSEMLVFGGVTDAETGGTATGGIYIESTNAWRGMASTNAPSARTQHTGVWCGDRMIIWGGNSPQGVRADGGSFVPPLETSLPAEIGTWTSLPASANAGVRRRHSAIWTGSQMIIFGGLDQNGDPLATGARLTPSTGTWTAVATANAPVARFGHTAVWTGSQMIVFGGANSEVDTSSTHVFATGAIYDPSANTWTALPTSGAPEARVRHSAVWTGTEMLIFGGDGVGGTALTTAAAYNPTTNTWRNLPAASAADTRLVGAWTGDALLAFGVNGLVRIEPTPTFYLYGRF